VMAVELLSGRILAPNFGNSIYVWGGVITVFIRGGSSNIPTFLASLNLMKWSPGCSTL
jgi:hypothetical protein